MNNNKNNHNTPQTDSQFFAGFAYKPSFLKRTKKELNPGDEIGFHPAFYRDDENNRFYVGHRDINGIFHVLGMGNNWEYALQDAKQFIQTEKN